MAKVCVDPPSLDCDECKELSQLLSNLVIAAGLAASTAYYIWVVDKFGNIYRDQYITNGAGSFTLLNSNYPDGFFNPYAGAFTLITTMDQAGTVIVPMVFSAVDYNCVKLTISGCA